MAALGLMLLVTQDFYPLVLQSHAMGQNAAWILALLAAVLSALMVWPVAAVIRKIPRGGLSDLVHAAVGRPGLIIYATLVAALFCFLGGMVLRETSEMVLTAFFPHTPQTFATTALLFGAIYAAFGTTSGLVRLGRFLLGVLLTSVFLIILGTMGWGNPRYLLPFWGPGLGQLVLSAPAVSMMFGPILVVLLQLADGVSDRERLVPWIVGVAPVGGLIFALVKADLVMVYAFPMGRNIPYPLHEAARLVVGGRFFERIEGVWLLLWVLATMLYLGVLLSGAAHLFTIAFGIPRPVTAVLPLATVVLTLAFFSPDQATTIAWHEQAAAATFVITLLIPLLLAPVAAIRLRRRAR